MGEPPLIVTSVDSRVVQELADSVERAINTRPDVRTGIESTTWAAARSQSLCSSILIRARGFLFPFRVDLGPRAFRRVIIATTNPFLLPAVVAFRRPRAQLVTLVYDLYPESLEVRFALPRVVRALLSAITAFGLRRSAAVVFLGERTRDYVVERYALDRPTAVIPPGCGNIPDPKAPPPSLQHLAASVVGRVVISYVGNLGSVHDAATLAEAIRRTISAHPDRCAVIISARGDRAGELLRTVKELPGVTILGRLDADEWAWVTRRTDIALASLDAAAGLVSLPSKVFANLVGGSAILAVAPSDSDLADLVRIHRAGVVTPPGDGRVAAEALLALVGDDVGRARYGEAALSASARFTPDQLHACWSRLLREIDRA